MRGKRRYRDFIETLLVRNRSAKMGRGDPGPIGLKLNWALEVFSSWAGRGWPEMLYKTLCTHFFFSLDTHN